MSSTAFITIDGYPIFSEQNNIYHTLLFKKSDRKIASKRISDRNELTWGKASNNDNPDEEEICYTYEVPAKIMKRRLELAGHSLSALKCEFEKAIKERLKQAEYLIIGEYEHCYTRDQHIHILETATFDEWLNKLQYIIQTKLQYNPWSETEKIHDNPIVSILLKAPYYQDEPFCTLNFPCMSIEGFARAVLEICNDDALCILDATDVVNGGWADDFEDLIEYNNDFTTCYKVFDTAIKDIITLIPLSPKNNILARLLYANVITAMETYFSDTLKKHVINRPALLRRFVENEDLGKGKINFSEIFKQYEQIEENTVRHIEEKITFHNLPVLKRIYKSVFDANFPELEFSQLRDAINKRHDIIHRNGKNKSGRNLTIAMPDVEQLIEVVVLTVQYIDKQIKDGIIDLNDVDID